MHSKLLYCLSIFAFAIMGCAADTGVNPSSIDNTYMSSSYDSFIWNTYVSSSSAPKVNSYFPGALTYIGLSKSSANVMMIMKNNTTYHMSIRINYTLSCVINGNQRDPVTKTIYYSFHPYEQIEESVYGNNYIGINTLTCSGTILSITPDYYDKSNFQAWTGNYSISIK